MGGEREIEKIARWLGGWVLGRVGWERSWGGRAGRVWLGVGVEE